MDRVIYTAMTGAKSTLGQQAAVAHNLANVDSTGFRGEMHKMRAVEVQTQAWHTRAFVVDASIANDFSQGPLKYSGGTYDVALRGKGWLTVRAPDGSEAYTRDGALKLSANGVLQTHSGLPVMGDGGPIGIPPENIISIGNDGVISAIQDGVVNEVARLKLVNPPEDELVRGEDGLFRLKSGQPAPVDETVQVAGGYLESSNINVAEQMVQMISLARQFEMQMRMITSAQENDRSATQIIAPRS
ncbi:MAG: flagellar basal body rod protein FlgF [Azoarcus sp.]|jgi:flagellar basal-body rod protein FlgF|nr:flagellar basal body rod protein FlgF [Azoarcus sp.]